MIAVTKFTDGAWAVMVLVPVMVSLLVRMNHQYEREDEELGGDLVRLDANRESSARSSVLLVEDVRPEDVHALQYAKTIRAERTHGRAHRGRPAGDARARDRVEPAGLEAIPLKVAARPRRRGGAPGRVHRRPAAPTAT